MDQQQVNIAICNYSKALHAAQELNQQNVEMIKELSASNEKLSNDVTELKGQMQQLMSNMQSERTEHQRVLEKAQIDAKARAKAIELEYVKAFKEANIKLRTDLQQAHENENEQLVRNYEREGCHKEKQYKQRIKEYEAQRTKDFEQAELKDSGYQSKLDEMTRQIEAIKAETSKKLPCLPQPSARKSLGTLRKEVF